MTLRPAAARDLATKLEPGCRLTVMTGAGVSAASGIPTFRGTGGLWRSRRAEQLATPQAFEQDPRLVWEWYDWRRQQVAAAQPNAAHTVLARWSQEFEGFRLITQNVDGLHERAGTRNIVRFHGSLWTLRCWNRCGRDDGGWHDDTVPLPLLPPRCPVCGGLARPGVVWFGEAIDESVIRRSSEATDCDVFIAVGTSALVYPAAALVDDAKRRGALTVEINPDTTPASTKVDLSLRGPASEILVELDENRRTRLLGRSTR